MQTTGYVTINIKWWIHNLNEATDIVFLYRLSEMKELMLEHAVISVGGDANLRLLPN